MGNFLESATGPLTLAILGTGAMGRFWADQLHRLNPWIVGHIAPPYRVVDDGTVREVNPRYLKWHESAPVVPEVVLLATKWRKMSTAFQWISAHAPSSLVVSLMNGMGQEEALAPLQKVRLCMGATTAAVTRQDREIPTIIVQSLGATTLPDTDDEQVNYLKASPLSHPWQWVHPDEMLRMRWQKLIQNSVINPLTALADCPNDALLTHPIWGLAEPLILEAQRVASTAGIVLPNDMLTRVSTLLEQTHGNMSSMVQDVRDKVPTEIDAINGYLVRLAGPHGFTIPTHEALIRLIKSLPTRTETIH